MSTIRNPPKRKRRFRFSLRALIILVLVAGSWMGWLVRSAHLQRAAVASIQQADGYVEYQWDFTNPNRQSGRESWWPKWLVDRIGIDYFYSVITVGLNDHTNDLGKTRVTAAGLAHLKVATQLEELNLAGTRLTDIELVHLQGMASLKFLGLGGTAVTDAGVDELQRALPNLATRRCAVACGPRPRRDVFPL